ncbi:hypothetical protein CANARDRAFT_214991 [[Candida] arabinofermentans NRRL YB-2248]|uniref:Protein FMP42 n=1 Tax=[Candida] arabinofermentans NRRL YB-2248 TaxID=983967 RepID=A0A1E4STM1_9ASCO|nr:hypothetical protein CANARDRAFT_214991 [[Candida] arabinofermentans NRRL YB-2248]
MYFFEATTKRRSLQVACAVVWCLFGAGPIFGFAALKPTLVDQGIYSEVCDFNTTLSSTELMFSNVLSPLNLVQTNDFVAKCTTQDLKLNMMFTAGAVLTNVSALVIGRTLDAFGPRVCGLIGATFLFLASIIFINARKISIFDPYLIGYSFMALGGPFSYISSFQLSNAFPEKSGLILALLTGAFDTSSAVFLIYKLFYKSNPVLFKLENFYKVYLFVPLFIAIVQLTIMPSESYLTPPPDLIPNPTPEQSHLVNAASQESHLHEANENTALLAGQPPQPSSAAKRRSSIGEAYKSAYVEDEIEETTKKSNSYSIFGILHGFPASYQFRTYWFVLIAMFATIQMLRLNYFVATVNSQYTYLLGSYERSEKLNKIFDIALPLGGVVSIPFVGIFLDSFSTSIVLAVLFLVSIVIGLLGTIKNSFGLGVLNVLLFVSYRPFFYTSISDYCAKVFGFETFGTVYGSIMTISGIFNFLQSDLDRLTHTTFQMNPIPLNLVLLFVTLIVGGCTVIYVFVESKAYNKKKLNAGGVANAILE